MIIQAHRLQEYFYFEHIDNKDVETQCHYIRGKKVQEFKDQIHRVPIFLINDGVEDPGDQIEATSRYVDIDEKLRFRVEWHPSLSDQKPYSAQESHQNESI